LLALLGRQMKHRELKEDQARITDAIFDISDESLKIKALRAAAASIVWLKREKRDRLLSAIKTLNLPYERAKILRTVVDVVQKIWVVCCTNGRVRRNSLR